LEYYDLVLGHDASDVDAVWRTGNGETLQVVSGRVAWSGGGPAIGARVGVFLDGNANGMLDDASVDLDGDGQPDDHATSYLDVAADSTFSGQVPAAAGNLLVRAAVKNQGRSEAVPLASPLQLTVPSPIRRRLRDPCKLAALAPEAMTVQLVALPHGFARYEATVQVTLDAADLATRAGATGKDAWLVFRARGNRGIFPILEKADTVSADTMPALMRRSDDDPRGAHRARSSRRGGHRTGIRGSRWQRVPGAVRSVRQVRAGIPARARRAI
jgi:hypothetical protein